MRKIIGFYIGPVCGTDATEAFVVSKSATNDEILDYIVDWANQEHEQWVDGCEDEGIDDDGPDYYFEDYDPEKHDMLKAGGGDWDYDFERLLDV